MIGLILYTLFYSFGVIVFFEELQRVVFVKRKHKEYVYHSSYRSKSQEEINQWVKEHKWRCTYELCYVAWLIIGLFTVFNWCFGGIFCMWILMSITKLREKDAFYLLLDGLFCSILVGFITYTALIKPLLYELTIL